MTPTPHPADALPLPDLSYDDCVSVLGQPTVNDLQLFLNDYIRAARREGYELAMQQRAGAVVSDAPKYRLLQRNVDVIEATDEFLAEDAETWAIDPNGIFVGNTYGGMVLRPARRAVLALTHGKAHPHD